MCVWQRNFIFRRIRVKNCVWQSAEISFQKGKKKKKSVNILSETFTSVEGGKECSYTPFRIKYSTLGYTFSKVSEHFLNYFLSMLFCSSLVRPNRNLTLCSTERNGNFRFALFINVLLLMCLFEIKTASGCKIWRNS